MKHNHRKSIWLFILVFALPVSMLLVSAEHPSKQIPKPKYPDVSRGAGKKRGAEPMDKLAPELRILYGQYTTKRGSKGNELKFSDEQLSSLFSIKDAGDTNPTIDIAVRMAPSAKVDDLKRAGAKIYLRTGDTIFAGAPVRSLERIARERSVVSIAALKAASVPPIPKTAKAPILEPRRGAGRGAETLDNRFNSQNLTGKGVIVGVVDTGIDWKHPDFINADGTSRILYIWDQTDESFKTSGGQVGTRPPILQQGGDPGPGTVYTNAQINAALRGEGTVNSMDYFGHGTAVAGTAAGNGRAAARGVPEGTYKGVAPEADLVIVKAGACGSFSGSSYLLGTRWVSQVARERHQPVVVNLSLGGQLSAHDGSEEEEHDIDAITGAGKPGIAVTISAGNEGQWSFHGSGRFGPRAEGQADIEGPYLEVAVSSKRRHYITDLPAYLRDKTWLTGYFHSEDEWGLVIRGSGDFLVDEQGKPFDVSVYKSSGTLNVQLQDGVKKPAYFDSFQSGILKFSQLAGTGAKWDSLWIPLPPGTYYVWGFGPTANVKNGTFNLYSPFYTEGAFTVGAQKKMMVGSPGNATNAITVASYDFRRDWDNQEGRHTSYNLPVNRISEYSSPGGVREDGIVKPEIAAPARYTISSLSQAAKGSNESCGEETMGAEAGTSSITTDGFHIAWAGTSAAAPFTAGVVALMLEKNPNLDANQIKQILIKTAKHDRYVGAVPNPEWGYGKINPAAAIAATPSPGARPIRKPRAQ